MANWLFREAPLWSVTVLLFLVMGLAREFGAWAHRREGPDARKDAGADEGFIVSAVLGLLALLVAFSFGMALNRYEARRQLVVAEANALDTAFLRTAVLADPAKLRHLMLQYAETRLTYGQSAGVAQDAATLETEQLRQKLWSEAVLQTAASHDSTLAELVLTPLGEAFDAAAERKAELTARMPLVVLVTLSAYFIAAAGVLGYASERGQARHRVASFALFALFTLALGVILDLDRPTEGLISLPEGAMIDTVATMREAVGP
jgi:hypothetical protein